jgi:hypothetical protein
MSPPLRTLRQVAGRLQAVVKQRTRLINQFHHLLALTFPELALLSNDIAAGWVLELVHRYPTAPLLATATPDDLAAVPYLPHKHIDALLQHARASVASQSGAAMEQLLRDQVRQLRDTTARQKRLENLLVSVYQELPDPNYIETIPGIGPVTAAVLTAFILDIDRFETVDKLVAYFGILPIGAHLLPLAWFALLTRLPWTCAYTLSRQCAPESYEHPEPLPRAGSAAVDG